MTVANLQTEYFEESAGQIETLYTETFLFEPVVTVLTADLSTEEWSISFMPVIGELPVFSPSLLSAVARVQQNTPFPQFVVGGQGNVDNYGLFKKSNDYLFSLWRSPVYRINQEFDIMSIVFPLHLDLEVGTRILPKLYFDDGARTVVGTEINLTNYSNTNKLIKLLAKNFNNEVHGEANFFLELQFLGSDLAAVGFPMTIDLELLDT